jgi:SnoaL-like domain
VLSFMRARPRNTVARHICSPLVMEEVGPDTARGASYLTFYEGEPLDGSPARLRGPTAVAEYHDEFRRTPQGWRISRRQVVPIMLSK